MKIALGTVQFGLPYGLSNQFSHTDKLEAERILKYAYDKGIRMLDTAPSYGNAEDVIGSFIRNHHSDKYWDVITKTPHFKDNTINGKQIKKLFESFELSQERLGQETTYGLLVHDCNNLFLPGGEDLLKTMSKLKDEGFIKKIGVSIYDGSQIDTILDNYSIDLIQLPVNILDQRLLDGGQLKRLKKYGVEIHARSVFLQGLLLMQQKNIPVWFENIKDILNIFHVEARKRDMSVLQLALGFVQSINEVDKIIVGVNTKEHLHEIINATSIRVNIDEFSNLSINNSIFLNPSNWKV